MKGGDGEDWGRWDVQVICLRLFKWDLKTKWGMEGWLITLMAAQGCLSFFSFSCLSQTPPTPLLHQHLQLLHQQPDGATCTFSLCSCVIRAGQSSAELQSWTLALWLDPLLKIGIPSQAHSHLRCKEQHQRFPARYWRKAYPITRATLDSNLLNAAVYLYEILRFF